MIDHVTIRVSDLEKSRAFYESAFEPLGHKVTFGEKGIFWAFDVGNGTLFEIAQSQAEEISDKTHVALRAREQKHVNEFYQAGLAAGGRDNGAPGPRTQYTPNYYAAFLLDPDGHNIEVMHDNWES